VNSRVIWSSVAAAAAACLLALSACGGDGGDGGDAEATRALAATSKREISAADFAPSRFDRSSNRVDNVWFPLRPGTRLVHRGSTLEDEKRVPHEVIWTVTDLTKTIAGVRNAVIWEEDYREGELVEAELALFAQDRDGNVWHLGQYPEEYEEGKLAAAPAWFHGIKGAKAGIAMKAKPKLGSPDYSQGFAPPPINWIDRARMYKQGVKTCVPAGCYTTIVTREFEPGKPDSYQLKYYARGVGNVRVGWMGEKDQDKEELILVKIMRLNAQQMAKARNAALKLERNAYKISKGVYGRTAPMTR
jgi:hypothetical protein